MEFPNHTVLIIDDEAPYRKFFKTVIEKKLKSTVYEAKNPKEAFEFLKEKIPSAILLDMQMPVMDGLTALKYLRQVRSTKNIPVIACTALSSKRLLQNLVKLGISDYIVKPASQELVLQKVARLLDKIDPAGQLEVDEDALNAGKENAAEKQAPDNEANEDEGAEETPDEKGDAAAESKSE